MKTVSKVAIFLLQLYLIVFLSLSCKKDEDVIPYVQVNFTISLSDPDYSDLNAIGNSLVVFGGYNGIVIYRLSNDEFLAYERSCTYEPTKQCDMTIDVEVQYLISCNCCNSVFLLIDGSPTDDTKPAILPLKQYQAVYYQDGNFLHVFN